MDTAVEFLDTANRLYARADPSTNERPPAYKAVGISLAVASGVFIGCSFVLKKMGLLKANEKYKEEAGEGYGYLKNAWWWSGMTLMIIGEICNFVAYAFVDAILVTPLGALSVVITTILSAIFLKERLSFVGKVGCFNCIIGSIIIVVNAPSESSAANIEDMKHFVIAPGFLSYAGVVIVASAFIALWAGPRYGKRSMLVYISICSLIGGLSVVATQGLGAAVVAQAGGKPQFNQWFLYVLFVFVIATLVTEIIFLNKALNLFNAALVTPTYYVFFTSSTIVTSAILFQGFKGSPASIATVVMGFLQICSGVILLQLSKSAKDVPDTAVFTGDLDQVRTVAEQEQPESEPKADAIRGAAAIVRRFSVSRQKMEQEEARRLREEKQMDLLAINEDENIEWDGLRRRRTTWANPGSTKLTRQKTVHPPLGLTKFPDAAENRDEESQDANAYEREESEDGGIFGSFRRRAKSVWYPHQVKNLGGGTPIPGTPVHPVPLSEMDLPSNQMSEAPPTQATRYQRGASESTQNSQRTQRLGLPSGLRPPSIFGSQRRQSSAEVLSPMDNATSPDSQHTQFVGTGKMAKRQFSFQNVFHRNRGGGSEHEDESVVRRDDGVSPPPPPVRRGMGSRQGSKDLRHAVTLLKVGGSTEEERLGLVKGDSTAMLPHYSSDMEEDWNLGSSKSKEPSHLDSKSGGSDEEAEDYEKKRRRWRGLGDSPSASASPQSERDPEKEMERERRTKDWDGRSRGGEGNEGPGSGSFL
ncbi:MAG: hypothetical protein M1829_004991 [Trizodia sp. TS-e1964]|nr:MAG: hypothetical protein M1829_004991 [Trizodia sp. TS-e1964]